jgi:hypothetical protein
MINIDVEMLSIRHDLHPIGGKDHTASAVRDTINGHAALETDAHTAERNTSLATYRPSKCLPTGVHHRRGDRRTVLDLYLFVIDD